MKNLFKYMVFLLTLVPLSSCFDEDSGYMVIDKDYIQFVYNGQNTSFKTTDFTNISANNKVLLLFDHNLYMQDFSLITKFEILDNKSITISIGKTLGYMRIQGNLVTFHSSTNTYNSTSLNEVVELPSLLQQGTLYTLGFLKTNNGITFFLEGTGISLKKEYDINKDFLQCLMRGKPFLEIGSGSLRVHSSELSANYNRNPKVSVYGDSFVEGIAMYQYGLNLNDRWCIKLADEIGSENCFLDGKGGERVSREWLDRLKLENSWFKSEYVVLSMGTNNYNYNDIEEYKEYIQQAINYLKNNGQIPILVTITPRSGITYHNNTKQINDWVTASGLMYIDIHKAVTKEGDPSQWKDGYILPDGIHPTTKGYEAMYEQVKTSISNIVKVEK